MRITIEGNITADPEARQVGDATVANFTVAVTSTKKDGDAWVDKGTGFFSCAAWRRLAPAVMNNLRKGSRVIVTGDLSFRDWTGREGNTGTAMELEVIEVGPSLRFHDAQVVKRTNNASAGGGAASHYGGGQSAAAAYGQQPAQQQPQQQGYGQQTQQDPWGNQQQPQGQQAWGNQQAQQQWANPGQQPPAQAGPPQQQAAQPQQAANGWTNPGANFDDVNAPF